MATALDIAKHNPNAAPLAVSDAARAAGFIEKKAELTSWREPPSAALRSSASPATSSRHSLPPSACPSASSRCAWPSSGTGSISAARSDFAEMTNVGKELRARLAEAYTLDRPQVVSEQVSKDGTRKWLIRMASTGPLDKGAEIECVYIPEVDRGTLCVSSQVGCTLTCSFCHTGTQRLVRNLTSAEIVAQLVVARDPHRRLARCDAAGGRPRGFCPPTAAASCRTSCSWAWASRSTTPTT